MLLLGNHVAYVVKTAATLKKGEMLAPASPITKIDRTVAGKTLVFSSGKPATRFQFGNSELVAVVRTPLRGQEGSSS